MKTKLYLLNRAVFSADALALLKGKLDDAQNRKLELLNKNKQGEFVLSRSLLKYAIKEELSNATDIRIEERPQLAPKVAVCKPENICFSISHSHNLIAVCISKGANSIGLDVELIPSEFSLEKAAFFCNEQQVSTLTQFESATDRSAEAIKLWTLKEAYFKSSMIGVLNKDLKALSFVSVNEKVNNNIINNNDNIGCLNSLYALDDRTFQVSVFSERACSEIDSYVVEFTDDALCKTTVSASCLEWQQYDLLLPSGSS